MAIYWSDGFSNYSYWGQEWTFSLKFWANMDEKSSLKGQHVALSQNKDCFLCNPANHHSHHVLTCINTTRYDTFSGSFNCHNVANLIHLLISPLLQSRQYNDQQSLPFTKQFPASYIHLIFSIEAQICILITGSTSISCQSVSCSWKIQTNLKIRSCKQTLQQDSQRILLPLTSTTKIKTN